MKSSTLSGPLFGVEARKQDRTGRRGGGPQAPLQQQQPFTQQVSVGAALTRYVGGLHSSLSEGRPRPHLTS